MRQACCNIGRYSNCLYCSCGGHIWEKIQGRFLYSQSVPVHAASVVVSLDKNSERRVTLSSQLEDHNVVISVAASKAGDSGHGLLTSLPHGPETQKLNIFVIVSADPRLLGAQRKTLCVCVGGDDDERMDETHLSVFHSISNIYW